MSTSGWQLVVGVIVLASLVGLLVVTSRRYGRPRLNMRPVVALWVVAGLLAAILLWIAVVT